MTRLTGWSFWGEAVRTASLLFFFFLLLLSLGRIFFVCWLFSYCGSEVAMADVRLALWQGFCLSSQTAGALTLLPLGAGFFAALLYPCWRVRFCRFFAGIELLILSVLYIGSFPYYRQFHTNYNQLLFNAGNDDLYALFISLVKEFYLPLRFLAACLLAYALYRLLVRLLALRLVWQPCSGKSRLFLRALACTAVLVIAQWSFFGGSFCWQTAVDWENAGVTKDNFLNEAILDNVQAVYRGYRLNGRMEACNGLSFTPEEIKRLAAELSGKEPVSDELDYYLAKQAGGSQLSKPRHIFIIIAESYANWPLLSEYSNLHIADGMKNIMAASDSDCCAAFLPNGSSTVSALTGIVTGFADANLYLTTMEQSFCEPYATAAAPIMARLGYQTNFWYAGPATWERIGAFTKAQGFASFCSRGDFGDVPGNVWGCDDEYLYQAVLDGVSDDEPSFNVILNVSNHSPFTVDLSAQGFPAEAVRAALPAEACCDEALLRELGHYWYEDKEMARFIGTVKAKYPDSLIVVIGDHADRYNIEKTPSAYKRYAIPFIITGAGVHKGLLPAAAAGSQIDVVPTLVELIAPQGFAYESVGRSLTCGNTIGVNYAFWITAEAIGKTDAVPPEPEFFCGGAKAIDEAGLEDYIDAVRGISWWRARYGSSLTAEP